MKLGIQINRFDWDGGPEEIGQTLKQIAVQADEAGLDSLWVMDHFFQLEMLGKAEDPMLEGYSVLNYLAAVTKKIKLGTLVTGVIYREPALLVKTVTALDVMSGGRAYFGIGAGWYEREAKSLGFLNPLTSDRFGRLEETLKIAKQMWAGDTKPFEGKHYQLEEPISSPQPLTKPHPPIMIGGGGEKRTLKLVAQYGDACNVFAHGGASAVKHKIDVLKQHCEDIGRDFKDIEITVATFTAINSKADAADLVKLAKELAPLGVHHITLGLYNAEDPKSIELLQKYAIDEIHKL